MCTTAGVRTIAIAFAALLSLRGAASAQDSAGDAKPDDVQAEIQKLRDELAKYAAELKTLQEEVAKSSAKPDDVAMRGRSIYRASCEACHGKLGDGKGRAAGPLFPKPRDFRSGNYKWRSTPTGSLPLDVDLFRTVSEGVPGTSMPSWKKLLTREERYAVIQWIKRFSPRFATEDPDEPIAIATPPPRTAQQLKTGKEVYDKNKCWECHGRTGQGDGPSAPTLKDDKGDPIKAFDFTSGEFRCGATDKDVYRTFFTGINGTPMPAYEAIPEEQRWALVQYVQSLVKPRTILDYFFARPYEAW
jgi:mono/diheme cytochrome c family protein